MRSARPRFWLALPIALLAVAVAGRTAIAGQSAVSNAPTTADAVMRAVDDRYEGDTRKQQGTLTLIDKRNSRRVRQFAEYTKKYDRDQKAVSHVLAPAEVKGTAFLSYEWKDRRREDETWLYLPELRKVKRLASTDKSGYFLGSDFTYWDLTGLDVDDFEYVFGEEEADSPGAWVIIATPKQSIAERVIEDTDYVKVKYWVDKEKIIILKAQYWLKEGQRIKYYSASDITRVSGVWTIHKMQMVMTQGGQMLHASVFELARIEYNVPIADQEFTTYALERPVN